jgi:hypothetical protein
MLAMLLVLATTQSLRAQDGQPNTDPPARDEAGPAAPPVEEDHGKFMRVVESENKSVISLEIATRTFKPKSGQGPDISLVGVAHIGDRSLYKSLQEILDSHDLVLYESVGPPGTGGAAGEDDEQRARSTTAALRFLAGMIEAYHATNSTYPSDLKALAEFAGARDARLADWIAASAIDAWRHGVLYRPREDGTGYELISLGSDGAQGGEGAASDLAVGSGQSLDMGALSDEDNLQGELAKALNLEFQLDAMSYAGEHWQPSDMAIDELQRAFNERGLDFEMIGGTLAGSSLPAKMIKVLLRVMSALDAMFDGRITDTVKVTLIEVLGDESLVEGSLNQMEPGFAEILLNERNQVVIDDLKEALASERAGDSVAIFYGAAHMKDMAKRLEEQLSYEHAGVQWIPAITVDLRTSAISRSELAQVRMMIRQMLRQQLGAAKRR